MDISKLNDEEIAELERAMKARPKVPPFPVTPHPTPPAPPKSDAERIKQLEQDVKDLKAIAKGLRTELWAEWQIVQDQVRSECHRLRTAPELPIFDIKFKNGAGE